jgi:hypothetical protein
MQRQTNRVCLGKVGSCYLLCLGVVVAGLLQIHLPDLVIFGVLAKISVEVSLHFFEENNSFCSLDVMFIVDDLFFQ